MNSNTALETLRRFLDENGNRYGILSMGIFGSTARDCSTEESDVDVVITLKEPNLFTLSRIRQELEEELHHHVDLVSYRERMNPFLKQRIEREARYV
jgi:predicted nucleotidyltransferase